MRNLFLLLLLLNLLLALWEGQPHLMRQQVPVVPPASTAADELPSWVLSAELQALAGTPEPPTAPMPTPPLARLQPLAPESDPTHRAPPRCYQLAPFADAAQRDEVLRRLGSANFVLLAPMPTHSFDAAWVLTLPADTARARLDRTLNRLGFEHYVSQDPTGETRWILSGFASAEAANAAQLRLAQQGLLFRVERRQPPPSDEQLTIATTLDEAVAERLETLLQGSDGRRVEAVVVPCAGELIPLEP